MIVVTARLVAMTIVERLSVTVVRSASRWVRPQRAARLARLLIKAKARAVTALRRKATTVASIAVKAVAARVVISKVGTAATVVIVVMAVDSNSIAAPTSARILSPRAIRRTLDLPRW